jgi:23S rRNA pseudouridine2457 synthase
MVMGLVGSKRQRDRELIYLLFHKPYQVLCQFSDPDAIAGAAVPGQDLTRSPRRTLKDFVPVGEVYPLGRLDWDSEGLLLLSNDGGLQHRLTDPKFGHPRTYWVQVERVPDGAALGKLRTGVAVKDYVTRPAQVKLLTEPPPVGPRIPPIRDRQSIPTAWLEMTLTEGRNRQVRRMTAAVGFPTLRLVRAAIGPLTLADLEPGQWRSLTADEVAQLRAFAQGSQNRGGPRSRRPSPNHRQP